MIRKAEGLDDSFSKANPDGMIAQTPIDLKYG